MDMTAEELLSLLKEQVWQTYVANLRAERAERKAEE